MQTDQVPLGGSSAYSSGASSGAPETHLLGACDKRLALQSLAPMPQKDGPGALLGAPVPNAIFCTDKKRCTNGPFGYIQTVDVTPCVVSLFCDPPPCCWLGSADCVCVDHLKRCKTSNFRCHFTCQFEFFGKSVISVLCQNKFDFQAGGQPRVHSWLPNEEGYATTDMESDQLHVPASILDMGCG